jgi:hypothetical protein
MAQHPCFQRRGSSPTWALRTKAGDSLARFRTGGTGRDGPAGCLAGGWEQERGESTQTPLLNVKTWGLCVMITQEARGESTGGGGLG